MRIRVDRALCMGHAMCHAQSEELFPLDELGYIAVDEVEVPSGLEDAAIRGCEACPERALTHVED